MMRAMYQVANITKAWWNFCQWSLKNRWVKPTLVMTHNSLCNECHDKRTDNIMRCFAGSVRRPWEDAVWSHIKKYGVGVNLTYTWPEESDNLDGIWDEITTDFLNFLDQWIEKKPSMDDVAIRCELWESAMMIWRQVNKKNKYLVHKNRQERITTDEEIEKTPQSTLMRKNISWLATPTAISAKT
jgi:hypothetical protein